MVNKYAIYETGSEVYWNDPDESLCSGYHIIKKVMSDLPDGEAIYSLDDGTEVFEHELE